VERLQLFVEWMDIKKKIMANCFQPEDIERARTIERELQQNFEIDKLIEEAEGTSFADPMLQLREAFEKLDTQTESIISNGIWRKLLKFSQLNYQNTKKESHRNIYL
jgi:hypothetical protein